jgi:hypothetical protein
MHDILCTWGTKCKTAQDFVETSLLSDLTGTVSNFEFVVKQANLLTEFCKHIDLVDQFGEELVTGLKGSMKGSRKAFLETAEGKLKMFMEDTGDGVSEIDSINSWVRIMSCTGVLHGSTFLIPT